MQPERAKHFNRNPPSSYHKSLHRNNGSFFGLFLIVRRFPFKRTRLVHVSHVFLFQAPPRSHLFVWRRSGAEQPVSSLDDPWRVSRCVS